MEDENRRTKNCSCMAGRLCTNKINKIRHIFWQKGENPRTCEEEGKVPAKITVRNTRVQGCIIPWAYIHGTQSCPRAAHSLFVWLASHVLPYLSHRNVT